MRERPSLLLYLLVAGIKARARAARRPARKHPAEFARQIAWADVFTCCNDGGGKARADLAGFHHGLAVGLADDRPGKERVARAGRILDVDLFRGAIALLAVKRCKDRALSAHRDDHAADLLRRELQK